MTCSGTLPKASLVLLLLLTVIGRGRAEPEDDALTDVSWWMQEENVNEELGGFGDNSQMVAPRRLTADTVTVVSSSSCYGTYYCPNGKAELLSTDFHLDGFKDSYRRRRAYTFWQTSSSTNGAANWLRMEFSKPLYVKGLWLRMDTCHGSGPQGVTLQSMNSSGSWVDEKSVTRASSDVELYIPMTVTFVAKEVRLYVTSWYTWGCAGSDTLRLYSLQFDYSQMEPCPAGTSMNSSYPFPCVDCPEGSNSYGGYEENGCLPLLGHALKTTQPPRVDSIGSAGSLLRITVHLSELPAIYEGDLHYVIDLAPTAGELSVDSECTEVWDNATGSYSATFRYDDLNTSCRLNVTEDASSIIRRGILGVFVVLTPTNDTMQQVVVGEWLYTVPVVYPKSVLGTKSISEVWEPLWNTSLLPTHPGNFRTSLLFFKTHLFQLEKEYLIYHDGDSAWVRLQLETETFALSVKYVLLSTSADASDESAIVHNLTAQERQTAPGRVDFQLQLQRCSACFLHVWAEVSLRRLTTESLPRIHYAYQVAPIVIEAKESDGDELAHMEVEYADSSSRPAAPLVMPLGVAVPAMMAISFFTGVLSYFVLVSGTKGRTSAQQARFRYLFVVIEFLDVGMDWLAFVLCRAEGDLNLEDGGCIEVFLWLSVILSTLMFAGEGAIALAAPTWMNQVVPTLICIHFMGEDAFQLLLYAFAQACQASSGLGGSPSLMFSMCQAFLFVSGKLLALMFEQQRLPDFMGVPREEPNVV
mmetsp:Transcript_20/g.52  ORF Transcript_20/g.52 Transcript_20/m.52 type:complete len:754 (-) Transcript_20:57-2318(-)